MALCSFCRPSAALKKVVSSRASGHRRPRRPAATSVIFSLCSAFKSSCLGPQALWCYPKVLPAFLQQAPPQRLSEPSRYRRCRSHE